MSDSGSGGVDERYCDECWWGKVPSEATDVLDVLDVLAERPPEVGNELERRGGDSVAGLGVPASGCRYGELEGDVDDGCEWLSGWGRELLRKLRVDGTVGRPRSAGAPGDASSRDGILSSSSSASNAEMSGPRSSIARSASRLASAGRRSSSSVDGSLWSALELHDV